MALAVGAINSNLVNLGLRGYCSLNVETSETLDTHSFAVLIGVGATTVNPVSYTHLTLPTSDLV